MADAGNRRHWVIRVRVADRAGALTSIASAFSNRGISIDTVVGHGNTLTSGADGTVVVTFWCTEGEKDGIVRIVRRLSKATALEEHPYESVGLRTPRDVAGRETFLTCELVREQKGVHSYFVAGSPYELDPVLRKFIEDGILTDVVYSIIGL